MKKIMLFVAIVLSIAACKSDDNKCLNCKRTWSYQSYELTPDGQHLNPQSIDAYTTETFAVCGDDNDIANAEQIITNESRVDLGTGNVAVNISTGKCDCQ